MALPNAITEITVVAYLSKRLRPRRQERYVFLRTNVKAARKTMTKTSCLSPVPQTRTENLSEKRQATTRQTVEESKRYLLTAAITADAWYGSPAPKCSETNLALAVGRERSDMVTKITNEKVRAEMDPISSCGRILARIIMETRFSENCTAFWIAM